MRYSWASISLITPSDQRKVGIRMPAPARMVKVAMIAAVRAPKVTSGSEP
jgi:hypothetical protein